MKYLDQHGNCITLGKEIGKGGEATVFEVVGAPKYVAKIYSKAVDPDKANKLAIMPGLATPDLIKFAAWPLGSLTLVRGGPTIGVMLPRISGSSEIHELYNPSHRKVHYPKADWRFLIYAARNCAAALATLHVRNIVVGDFNQKNIFVSQDACVSLLDCDSFQLNVNGRLFRCTVGMPDFVPPELQGVHLASVIRTCNHDNFCLAIAIFHLLCMGRHPFSGRYSGVGDMPIEKAIKEYRFAYGPSAARLQMAPPPNALTLAKLPPEIGQLFERAFAKGSERASARPTAREWALSLDRLAKQLRPCSDDSGHVFFAPLPSCPWCDIARTGGPNFFIAVNFQTVIARSAAFNLAGIWAQIQAVQRPDQIFKPAGRSSTIGIKPTPIPPSADELRLMRNAVGIIALVSGSLISLGLFLPFVGVIFVLVCMLSSAWWIGMKMNSPVRKLQRQRANHLRQKSQDLGRARAYQTSVAQQSLQQFQMKFDALRQLSNTYSQFKNQRDAEIQSLQQQVRQRQLEEHLRRCFVSAAKIPDIGPLRTAALESEGIETAYDITSQAVRKVQGFGERRTESLLGWRREKEQEFRFNPSKGIPQADIQAVEMKYAQKRSQCERVLEQGPRDLYQISMAGKVEVERLDGLLARLEFDTAQSEADLRACDSITWWH